VKWAGFDDSENLLMDSLEGISTKSKSSRILKSQRIGTIDSGVDSSMCKLEEIPRIKFTP